MLFLYWLACGAVEKEKYTIEEENIFQDGDGDGYAVDEDCNDNAVDVYPGSLETCDGVDNNCNGEVDEDVLSTFYADADGDGFGNPDLTISACEATEGYVSVGTDCDDSRDNSYPGAEEICDGMDNDCDEDIDEDIAGEFYIDADGDGFGDDEQPVSGCSGDPGISPLGGDCNDDNPTISPFADEACDEIDNNCDGAIDEGVASLYYADQDNDGYGDENNSIEGCELPNGYVHNTLDCNDSDTQINPAADEYCDGVDNDCDEEIDEDQSIDALPFHADADQDGYGDPNTISYACNQPNGYVTDSTDCNDQNNTISPAITELCDGVDNNCDGEVDEQGAQDASSWYHDGDSDGYGNVSLSITACSQPSGYLSDASDCDDDDNDVYPGAPELCNGEDDNCDGNTDENTAIDVHTFYVDADSDGYGDPNLSVQSCESPNGYTDNQLDCNDSNPAISPDGVESCNGEDDNCDGAIDEDGASGSTIWYIDHDGDGFGSLDYSLIQCDQPTGYVANSTDCNDLNANSNPSALEVCDGFDNNCDGVSDDADSNLDTSTATIFYQDVDGDGYGDPANSAFYCSQPSDMVMNGTDCDDGDLLIFPGAPESCADIDQDCDGAIDNDADGDGYSDSSCGGSDCDDGNSAFNDNCPFSCQTIFDSNPANTSGSYTIHPVNAPNQIDVYCELTGSEGWTLLFSAPASNVTYGSSWDYWYEIGGHSSIIDPLDIGKSEAYDYLEISELRLTATYGSSEIIAPLNMTVSGLPDLIGDEITTCSGLSGVARENFSSSYRTGSYFLNDYIALVACDTDGSDLEFNVHYDAAVFSTNLNHGDYAENYGDLGSEYRVGGIEGDATGDSNNILRVWAR